MKIKIQKKPKTKTTIRGNIILLSQVYFVAKICLRHVFLLVLWIFLAFVWLNSKICLFTIACWPARRFRWRSRRHLLNSAAHLLSNNYRHNFAKLFRFFVIGFSWHPLYHKSHRDSEGVSCGPSGFQKTRKLKFVYQTVKPPHNNNND